MIKPILKYTFMDNRVFDYLIFVAIFIVGSILLKILKTIIFARLKSLAKKTANDIDDFLLNLTEKTATPLLYYGLFYLSATYLTLEAFIQEVLNSAGAILITVMGIRFATEIISYSLETFWVKKEKDPSKKGSLKGILTTVRIIIWGAGITFLLDNLGFQISTVIAGLGIGGVAVALAAQAILGDLFSYFSIFFDRPFEIGDFIIIGDYLGTIEHIGIKTTRIRSLGGEQLIFSNSDLTSARVRNYKRMEKRRVVFKLGVTYQTTAKQVRAIPEIIKKIVEDIPDTTFDRAHFFEFADFSLIYEIVYYIKGSDYNKYMDIQQEINFKLKDEFEKQSIEFAYPTQTLFMEKNNQS